MRYGLLIFPILESHGAVHPSSSMAFRDISYLASEGKITDMEMWGDDTSWEKFLDMEDTRRQFIWCRAGRPHPSPNI